MTILSRPDFILLNSYNTNQEKVEILMELMRKKSEEDHNSFLDVIEEDYKWLRDKCEIFLQKIRLDALLKTSKASTAILSNEGIGVRQVSKRKASFLVPCPLLEVDWQLECNN